MIVQKLRAWAMAEWLTALALLAMVAMIALPNFFEAKTRSNVSQVHADLRRLETALVAYKLDNACWIDDAHFWALYAEPEISCDGMNDPFIWGHLTTPISYIATIPVDPFQLVMGSRVSPHRGYWYYGVTGWIRAVAEIHGVTRDQLLGEWLIASPGPDKTWSYGEWNLWKENRKQGFPRMYDPSNGIVSYGDIVRWDNMERTMVAPEELGS